MSNLTEEDLKYLLYVEKSTILISSVCEEFDDTRWKGCVPTYIFDTMEILENKFYNKLVYEKEYPKVKLYIKECFFAGRSGFMFDTGRTEKEKYTFTSVYLDEILLAKD